MFSLYFNSRTRLLLELGTVVLGRLVMTAAGRRRGVVANLSDS